MVKKDNAYLLCLNMADKWFSKTKLNHMLPIVTNIGVMKMFINKFGYDT